MPKSQIIIDIVEENVSLEQSLNRLYILALDVENNDLVSWVEKELNGYKKSDEVPSYRKATGLDLRYSGINGGFQVNNLPLQPIFIKQEHRETLDDIQLREGIRFLSEVASSEQPATRDISYVAKDVYEISGGQVQCFAIHQIIAQSIFQKACAGVKHKMLQVLVELENKYGNLDSLGIDISAKKPEQLTADIPSVFESGTVLPCQLFSDVSHNIQSVCKQINASYDYGLYDCTAVMMRRLLEALLVLSYQQHSIAAEITDRNGCHITLDKIIKNAAQNSTLALSANTKRDMALFKDLGNYSAHKIWYNTTKQDISPHVLKYRVIIEELMYKAGIK